MEFQRLGAVVRGWLKPLQGARQRGQSRNQEGRGLGFVGEVRAEQNEHLGCRWIEDDPLAQHPYCGAAIKPRSSYCAEHHARAHLSLPLKPIAILKNASGEA
jgi:hypothetical protein